MVEDPRFRATAFEPGPLERAQHVADFVQANAQGARRAAEQAADDVMKFIAARPVASVLIGVAAGYILGWLATSAVRNKVVERRRAAAVRRLPHEREQFLRVREWPRQGRGR
jgi:hypothetical protein